MENQEFIARKLSGELTAEEAIQFENWLNASEENKTAWKQAELLWKISGGLDHSFEPDVEAALRKTRSRLFPEIQRPARFFTPLRIAASVLLLTAAGFYLFYPPAGTKKPVADLEAKKETQPAVAQIKMLVISTSDTAVSFFLSDSTHIILNKNSSLSYPENFNTDVRRVTLTGEAFFEVKHNDKIPFIITAGNTETKVLGTSFNIKEDHVQKKVELSVISGKVLFSARKDTLSVSHEVLFPQEQIIYSEQNSTMVRRKMEKKDYWWIKNLRGIRKLFRNAQKEINFPPLHK